MGMTDHSHSTPAVDVERNLVTAGSNSGHLFVFRDSDGAMLAKYGVKNRHGKEIKGAILLYQGIAIFGSWARRVHAFDLNHLRSSPGTADPVMTVESEPSFFWKNESRHVAMALSTQGWVMSSVAIDPKTELL